MLVQNWMIQPVITAEETDTIKKAKDLLTKHQIRSLPVLSNDKLVGIVTDRDLKHASVSESTSLEAPEVSYLNTRVPIGNFMTENVITVKAHTTVVEVAKILLDKKISATPVVDDDDTKKVIGMITQGDIFRLLIHLTGFESKGLQIAVQISTETGTVKEVANTVREVGGRIDSLLTSHEGVPDGYRNAFFKAYNIDNPDTIKELTEKLKSVAKIRYVIEHFGENQHSKVWTMNI